MQHQEIRARIAHVTAELSKLRAELEELEELIDDSEDETAQQGAPCPLRIIQGGAAA